VRRPVDNDSLASLQHHLNANFQTRCVELSSCRQPTVPHFQCTFDLEHLDALEEFGTRDAADVSRCTNTPHYEPETNASRSTNCTDTGYHSQMQFPCKFDNNTDGYYHATSSNTDPVSIILEADLLKSDVYGDIMDDLDENIYCCSPSTGSGLGNSVHTSKLQTPKCRYSVDDTVSNNFISCQGGFQPISPRTLYNVNNKDKAVASLHTYKYLDNSDDQTLPLQTANSWFTSHSPVTESAAKQTCISGASNRFTSFPTVRNVQTVSNYQQQNWIQQQTSLIENKDYSITTPFKAFDISKHFLSTSSLKSTNTSQNRSIETPDLSQVLYISTCQEQPMSVASASPYHLCSTGHVTRAQTTCRRQLFPDTICCQKNSGYRVCKNSQQEQDRSPTQTYCAVVDDDRANDPFIELNFTSDLSTQAHKITRSTGSERHCCMSPNTREEDRSSLHVSSSPQLLWSEEVRKTQATRYPRLFDDSIYYEADEEYRVHKKSQQEHDRFQDTQPQISCAVVYKEDDATTSFRPLNGFDFSGSYSVFSSGEGGSAMTSCCRANNESHRVRKKSAATTSGVHRCHICERVYTRPSTLRDHVRDRHSTTPKQHVCSNCGRRFTQPSNLSAHLRTHTGTLLPWA